MSRNLMFDTTVEADVLNLATEVRIHQGVRFAFLPDDVHIVLVTPETMMNENLRVSLPETDPALIPFESPALIPSAQEIRQFAIEGYHGVVADRSGRLVPVKLPGAGVPPLLLAKVRFLVAPRAKDFRAPVGQPLFKVRDDGRMVIPLVGGLHVKGRELSDAELSQLGCEWLVDGAGRKLEYLALNMGNRSVFFPTKAGLGLAVGRNAMPLGWQWKGTGVRRYTFHTLLPEKEMHLLTTDDVALVGPDTKYIPVGKPIQRVPYAGKSGVFLDLRHQPSSDIPVGGETGERDGDETRLALVKAGASLPRLMSEVAEVVNRAALENMLGTGSGMTLPSVAVTCEVWQGGSTIRLDTITNPIRMGIERNSSQAVETARHVFATVVEAEYGEASPANMMAKLHSLAKRFGENVRMTMQAGRSLYVDRNSDDNLTTEGGLLDYGDYHKISGWHQLGSLLLRYLVDLHRLNRANGITTDRFFSEGVARPFLAAFLEGNEVDRLIQRGVQLFHGIEVAETASYVAKAAEFSSMVIAVWVRPQLSFDKNATASGVRYLDRDSVERYCSQKAQTTARFKAAAGDDLILRYLMTVLFDNLLLKDNPKGWRSALPVAELDAEAIQKLSASAHATVSMPAKKQPPHPTSRSTASSPKDRADARKREKKRRKRK